ncbi:hypothetical protein PILCRDRAFT_446424 [Piloderma croceum F 1598]|uniref:Uncharacterized protein n=1 Tax=Piloderma croceum (strain F 1598) TaxID=765440 RepID=A0A0C3FWS4_PILCF|nr:hypothetical protein PILCRDRAFT_446424 [Piloderma croceum F 1598]
MSRLNRLSALSTPALIASPPTALAANPSPVLPAPFAADPTENGSGDRLANSSSIPRLIQNMLKTPQVTITGGLLRAISKQKSTNPGTDSTANATYGTLFGLHNIALNT